MRLKRLVALIAVMGLSLMACEGDDDQGATEDTTPTPTPTATSTTGDGTEVAVDDDVLELVAQAAANTVDEGTARFTIMVGDQGTTGTTGTSGASGTMGTETETEDDATGTTGTMGTETETEDDATGTSGTMGTETETEDDATGTSGTTGTTGTTGTEEITVEGEVDFDEELRELQFVGPDGPLTMIIDGDELYAQLPATEGGEWARVDLSELSDGDIGFGGPAGIPFQDPQRTLDVLRDAAVEARQLDGGTGTGATETPTDGLGATETPTDGATGTPGDAAGGHYLVVIDLEQAGELTDTEGDHWAGMAERYGIETLDMEIWIDDEERIERITYTLPLSQASVEGEATEDEGEAEVEVDPQQDLVVTVDYYDFGTEVDITLPDDDEVVDLDEEGLRQMMEQQGGTGTGTGTGTGGSGSGAGTGTTGTATPTPTDSPSPTDTPTE